MGNVCGGQTNAVDAPSALKATTEPATEPAVAKTADATAVKPAEEKKEAGTDAVASKPAKKLKIFIIFYSTYGHVYKLAETYKTALEALDDVEVYLYQVAETLPAEVLEKMHAGPKPDVPLADPLKLPEADAVVFGFPTRFGMMCSQMKNFFDATGMLWQNGALHGKPASLFTSTASQGGGQETTLMTAVTQLAHHGMIYVPAGYAAGQGMFGVQEAKGGSPWGAGTLAGPDGSRQPSEIELEAIRVQARTFAQAAKKLAA
ncbi:hypothetical protein PLESTB_000099200 [Pleodorina starrii]|uniref:NAD(P)H dehydrogenase (quinone) n=1 Tax=Pleodorina starrii TaxID=330485 RepID=A0A9W6EXN6_9CHLO|nr:hypothetical protein PLESTM_000095700 [Pleodorina starrii]GLC48450.1 hypothetical protein PLESTB_000099200 [Pleodorina starrii]GLC71770.1 hypothetical protein PLESTF_001165000 [Pleodorina starrii]